MEEKREQKKWESYSVRNPIVIGGQLPHHHLLVWERRKPKETFEQIIRRMLRRRRYIQHTKFAKYKRLRTQKEKSCKITLLVSATAYRINYQASANQLHVCKNKSKTSPLLDNFLYKNKSISLDSRQIPTTIKQTNRKFLLESKTKGSTWDDKNIFPSNKKNTTTKKYMNKFKSSLH